MGNVAGRLTVWAVPGGALVAAGIGQLAVAPLAVSCIAGTDYRFCETIGVIVLNVSGVACVLAGFALLVAGVALQARHKISA
jgi:hypothetical protein